MARRAASLGCALILLSLPLSACGASAPGWRPPEDRSADDAVLFVSSDCTAVLVGERSVLTAAHCVEEPGPWSVQVGHHRIKARSCAVHPMAYESERECGQGLGRTDPRHDLAVLTLAEAPAAPIVPVLLAPPELGEGWWSYRSVRLVGWDRRPRIVGPLARRSGLNRIVEVRSGTFVTFPELPSGFHTIIGDSGGPALVRVDGQERVAGILSGGTEGTLASIYVATFEEENARWLITALPESFSRDLSLDEASPFGVIRLERPRPGHAELGATGRWSRRGAMGR